LIELTSTSSGVDEASNRSVLQATACKKPNIYITQRAADDKSFRNLDRGAFAAGHLTCIGNRIGQSSASRVSACLLMVGGSGGGAVDINLKTASINWRATAVAGFDRGG
jgi:hypothetical protein